MRRVPPLRQGAPRGPLGHLVCVALALLLASAAATGVASASGSLAGEYAGLGERADDRRETPRVRPRPLAFPTGGPASAYPLRGPTTVRVVRGGAIVVTESLTGRVLRVGAGGRVSVLAGRTADWAEDCPAGRSGGVVAIRFLNQVLRVRGVPTATPIAGTGRTGFAGDGGPATEARLDGPTCAVTAADGSILVADHGNNRVRRIAPDGTITTIAGNGDAAFSGEGGPATAAGLVPQAIAALPDGGALVTDPRNARVLRIHPDGALSTFAGTGVAGWDGDGGPAQRARLTMPWGIARRADGTVFVADFGSQTVRRISPSGVITTVLGAPPQRVASPSRALSAWVPARRRVSYWINPQVGRWSSGETGTTDEAENGRRALIRPIGYSGVTLGVSVIQGGTTVTWWNEGADGGACWDKDRTTTGLAGDPEQARDLQAGARAGAPYAPGPGPYAPDLRRDGLILARAPVVLDDTPVFGVPAWETEWNARRLVEYLIDRRSGRVVAVQAWSPSGYQRQYRIRAVPVSLPLRVPSTHPRWQLVESTPTMSSTRCGPPGRAAAGSAFGYRDGIALARRVNRRLENIAAIQVRAAGTSSVGRPFTARSSFTLVKGRISEGLTQVAAPGRPQARTIPPGGNYSVLTTRAGETFYRSRGRACWFPGFEGFAEDDRARAPLGDLSRVMPMEDAFFELPRRRGGLLVLRAHLELSTVDSLIDSRDMRLVAQRWISSFGDRGVVRLTEVGSVPPAPDPTPTCGDDKW